MAITKSKKRGRSAIDVLEADHVRLRTLLGQLEKATTPDRRGDLLARTKAAIVLHADAEEAVFYPAFRDAARTKEDKKLFFEAHEEHHLVDVVIPELEQAPLAGDVFAAKAKVLMDLVEHHAAEEEEQMFPRARKLLDAETLAELGGRLTAALRPAALQRV